MSAVAAEATRVAAEKAKAAGARVSCDLNFRKKLWRWDDAKSPRDLAQALLDALVVRLYIGRHET